MKSSSQQECSTPGKSCPEEVVNELMPCCNASCARLRSSCTKTSPSVCNVTWRSHAKTTWIESMRHMKISQKRLRPRQLAWDESSIFHYKRVRYNFCIVCAFSIHLSSFIRCMHKTWCAKHANVNSFVFICFICQGIRSLSKAENCDLWTKSQINFTGTKKLLDSTPGPIILVGEKSRKRFP